MPNNNIGAMVKNVSTVTIISAHSLKMQTISAFHMANLSHTTNTDDNFDTYCVLCNAFWEQYPERGKQEVFTKIALWDMLLSQPGN